MATFPPVAVQVNRRTPLRRDGVLDSQYEVTRNLLLTTLAGQGKMYGAAGEVPSYVWPNQKSKINPVENRNFVDPSETWLIGIDKFFYAPGEGPRYDYPNPGVRLRPTENRNYISTFDVQNIGLDTFFGAPGEPPHYDWPNPKPRPSPMRAILSQPQTGLQELLYSGPVQYFLAALTGTYTVTGDTVGFVANRVMAGATGVYTVSGNVFTNVARRIATLTGTYTVTAGTVFAVIQRALAALTGTYAVTAGTTVATVARRLVGGTGSYMFSGVANFLATTPVATLISRVFSLFGRTSPDKNVQGITDPSKRLKGHSQ